MKVSQFKELEFINGQPCPICGHEIFGWEYQKNKLEFICSHPHWNNSSISFRVSTWRDTGKMRYFYWYLENTYSIYFGVTEQQTIFKSANIKSISCNEIIFNCLLDLDLSKISIKNFDTIIQDYLVFS